MRFEMLGPLRVIDDGSVVDLGGPRQRRVLAVLAAAAPGEVSVDRLIDEVWGDDAPDTASHVIRTYVSNLRAALGDRIVSDGRRYRLDTANDESDAAELTVALEEGRALLDVDAASALEMLEQATTLRRGRPFEDAADDAPSVRARAAELEEEHLQALELRIEAALRLGRHGRVIPELERLVADHPLREGLSARLMLALYRSGRQAEALRAYAALRDRLVEELGIDPSPDVRDLEERILLQDPGLVPTPPHNIPAPISSFVGRRHELAEVTKQVEAYRLLTLLGVGGVGKTRLATEAAAELLDEFPDGVWWVDLVPVDDPAGVAVRTAEVLRLSGQPGLPLEEVLGRFLSGRTTLLVFDNCEHLSGPVAELVATLLKRAPNLKVLATSRRPLQVTGEIRFPVPPMSVPDPTLTTPVRAASDAERLFVTRAIDADPSFAVGPDDVSPVARICRELDGLPLAIEMAAARAPILSPLQIAARLAEGPEFLSAPEADRDPRQHTIEATIEWSYGLLSADARLLFERVSVFAGAFDADAAAAIAGFEPIAPGSVLGAIATLVDASMLQTARSGDGAVRYRMLETLRRFAAARLEASGERDEAAERHARYHLGLAAEAGEHRTSPEFAPWMAKLDAVRDDLGPALEWSLGREPRGRTLQAVPGLLEYWQRRGDPDAAYRYGTRMLEGADDASPVLRAYALMCASFGAALSGDFELATRGPAEALALAADVDDWRCRLWAFMTRGQIATILGDLPAIEEMGREILTLCDLHDLGAPRAYGLSLLAEADFFADRDYDAARRHADAAIEGFRELQDLGGLKIYGLCIAAPVAALQRDFKAAERYATEAVALPGAAWSAAAYVILGGYVLHPRGDPDRAERVLIRGITLAYETSNEIWMRTGLLFLARVAAERQEWERAARLFGACRPNLPAWGQQPRWWTTEPLVRDALGDADFERLRDAGSDATVADIVGWIAAEPDS